MMECIQSSKGTTSNEKENKKVAKVGILLSLTTNFSYPMVDSQMSTVRDVGMAGKLNLKTAVTV